MLAIRLATAAISGAILVSAPLAPAMAVDRTPNAAVAANAAADVATTHILVRLAAGLTPSDVGLGGVTVDGGEIDALAAAWAVQRVVPVLSEAPRAAWLPSADRLARTHRFEVAGGSDTTAMAAAFAQAAGVEIAEVDGVGGISTYTPNDTHFVTFQWNLNNSGQGGGVPDADIDAPELWGANQGSGSVVLAILDTGIQSTHPDLAGRLLPGRNVYDNNDNTEDPHGHGSHVTGIAAGNGDNGIGIAGVNWQCAILPVRCTSPSGSTTESITADAIRWAADHNADVISMSLQFYTGTQTLADAVNYAHDLGVLLIAATGNSRGRTIAFPARFPNCMGVGATTRMDLRWVSSNYGPEIDVVAPGFEIYSCWNDSSYRNNNGTSMATPHVSGLAALLRGLNPALTPDQVDQILRDTADDRGATGFDEEYGHGRINAYRALHAASPYAPGDLNCDGVVNFFDIDAFLTALFDIAAYPSTYAGCDVSRGDFDGDANINFFDIDPFVVALFGQ